MNRLPLLVAGLSILTAFPAAAQDGLPERQTVWFAFAGPAPQDDPAYAVYRRGYGYVMDERWAEARATFEELQKRFPRSSYLDDAAYWSAYALGQMDRRKALFEYQRFLERFPRSRYFEDATADYAALRAVAPAEPAMDSLVVRFRVQGMLHSIQEHGLRAMELTIRRMNRSHRYMMWGGAVTLDDRALASGGQLDRSTRQKLDALGALGDPRTDEQSFRTLVEVVRDPRQPPVIRSVALHSLARFSTFDPLPVLVETARSDTSRSIQEAAILSIGQRTADQERSLESLAQLYAQLPRHNERMRLAIIDAAASIGTPEAQSFLVEVARTSPDTELQTLAIDNITVAGKDKHHTVELLIDLYRGLPPERKQARETALYGVAEMGTDRAVDFLSEVARSGNDGDLQRDAVIYLGTIGGTRARNALYEILRMP